MPFNTTATNQALNSLIATFTASGVNYTSLLAYATLHTAYSASGAFEITGGGYARQAVTWTAPSGGSFPTATVAGAFSIPANTTVAFVGLTSVNLPTALSSSNFAGMGANGNAAMNVFTSSANTGNLLTVPGATGLATGTPVVVWPGVGTALPSGLTAGNIYYIIGYSAGPPPTFQLSSTLGGSAVNLGTSAGSGLVQAITLETFSASGGSFTLTSDTLSLV